MNKKYLFYMLILLITLLQINYAFAVGISPAKRTIDYQQGKIEKFSYGIYNNERAESTIKIEARGGKLRDSIVFSEIELNFSSGELMKQIEAAISFPNSTIEQDEYIDVVAKEQQKKGAFVNIQLEVSSRIDIKAPQKEFVEIKEEKTKKGEEVFVPKEIETPKSKKETKVKEEKLSEKDLMYILSGVLIILIILQIYLTIYQYALTKSKVKNKYNYSKLSEAQNKKSKKQKSQKRWKKNKRKS